MLKKKKESVHVMICNILSKSFLTSPTTLLSIFNPSLWMTKLSPRESKLSWERKNENVGKVFLNDGGDNGKGKHGSPHIKGQKWPLRGQDRDVSCISFLTVSGFEQEVRKYRDTFSPVGLRRYVNCELLRTQGTFRCLSASMEQIRDHALETSHKHGLGPPPSDASAVQAPGPWKHLQ